MSFVTDGLTLNPGTAGVFTGIVGSLIIAAIVSLLAFPIGVSAAVYIEEYAPDNRWNRFLDTTVRNLAGVPSIVYGLLGLAMFVPIGRFFERIADHGVNIAQNITFVVTASFPQNG